VDYEFDAAKDESNLVKHGLSLADSEDFEWETAVVREDTRKQYAEQRLEATGLIGERLHVRSTACAVMSFASSAFARPTQER